MSSVISVENISKLYRLGEVGSGSISGDLSRWMAKVRGKEDPFAKIGSVNDRSSKADSDYVWSLKDINFEVKQGEVLGIIGRNGAGKSTLLKILSKVTQPTTGNIKVKGRIASLLEVGTGFHPELSGRDNIFLNGAILGMSKAEIKAKFDEIVAFSGVERYIDTPVKRYSSGMYVRLAFAVAAHLEPEILIVDEVLAVGDAEFQKKCLGKMKDVSGEGRTVLFVSHNMAAVKSLCNSSIILNKGMLVFSGNVDDGINKYFLNDKNISTDTKIRFDVCDRYDIQLIEASLMNINGEESSEFDISDEIIVKLHIQCNKIIQGLYAYVSVQNQQEESYIESDTNDYLPNIFETIKLGSNFFEFRISKNILAHGKYNLYLSFSDFMGNTSNIFKPSYIFSFTILDSFTKRGMNRNSYTSHLIKWNRSEINL